jgi:hypothetical protein
MVTMININWSEIVETFPAEIAYSAIYSIIIASHWVAKPVLSLHMFFL